MSLSAALNTAVIGLQTLQSQTRIAAGNVSNAQNPEYTRKVATLTTPAAEGLHPTAVGQAGDRYRVVYPEVDRAQRGARGAQRGGDRTRGGIVVAAARERVHQPHRQPDRSTAVRGGSHAAAAIIIGKTALMTMKPASW